MQDIKQTNQESQQNETKNNIAIAVHGGAGVIKRGNLSTEEEVKYHEALQESLLTGYKILQQGGSAIDAVIGSVCYLEDCPLFNAGKGSVFTHEGTVECDASLMEGKYLQAGCVGSLKSIKNPIKACKVVMENTKHVLLIGEKAEQFLVKTGNLETVPQEYFFTEKRQKQWLAYKNSEDIALDHNSSQRVEEMRGENKKFGTVGCVAVDQFGNVAAGTSTGGMTNKKSGRVGDSPIVGAGIYANNLTCAVSSTGHGELFIRGCVAHDIHSYMEYKAQSVQQAAEFVILKKMKDFGGEGGVIAIDNKGNISMPFNCEGMYRGSIDIEGNLTTFIYSENQ